ncbi:hypothetical protein ABEF95_014829 [Exophiala dermatitidis]
MCKVIESSTTVNGKKKTQIDKRPCGKAPRDGNLTKCPDYEYARLGSSRGDRSRGPAGSGHSKGGSSGTSGQRTVSPFPEFSKGVTLNDDQ